MHASSFHSAHQMYVTIMCTRLKHAFRFISCRIVLISVQDDGDSYESTLKDELPQPRGSLTNNIPLCAIEQANQEFRQDCRHSQHASNA